MRSFATSFLAFIVSYFAGGMIAVFLAIKTGGEEEWIAVFFVAALVAVIATIIFFIVQLVWGSRGAANVTAAVLLVIFAILLGALVAVTFWTSGPATVGGDLQIVAGLALPGAAIILVQWLIVRWRAPRLASEPASPRFGRGGQPS